MKEKETGIVAAVLLRAGATSPETRLSTEELRWALGMSDARTVQALIEAERAADAICSDPRGGYFLADPETADGQALIRSCAASIWRRGVRTLRTARHLYRLVRDNPEQMTIELAEEEAGT